MAFDFINNPQRPLAQISSFRGRETVDRLLMLFVRNHVRVEKALKAEGAT